MTEKISVGYGVLIGGAIGTMVGAYVAMQAMGLSDIPEVVTLLWACIIPTGFGIGAIIGFVSDLHFTNEESK